MMRHTSRRRRKLGLLAVLVLAGTSCELPTGPDPFAQAEQVTYTPQQVVFEMEPRPGTAIPMELDQVFGPLPVGFAFEFYGVRHEQFWLSTNGFITFSPPVGDDPSGCCFGRDIPEQDGYDDLIALGWTALHPPGGGYIGYETRGQPGDRRLLVSFESLNVCCEAAQNHLTTQLILFERDHSIEIHTKNLGEPLAFRRWTQGIENADGTVAAFVPGRVRQRGLVLKNDAVRFTTRPANGPPVADAGPDQVVECTADGCAEVQLDGSGSSDPDGDALQYAWFLGEPSEQTLLAEGARPVVKLGLGSWPITLVVTDGEEAASDPVRIDVVDTQPPEVELSIAQATLSPPNHQYVAIDVSAAARDVCDPELAIAGLVSSSEADNGVGDGDTTGDIRVTRPDGSVLLSSHDAPAVPFNPFTDLLEVRAERAGGGDGRVYTVSFEAVDDAGNSASVGAELVVPGEDDLFGPPRPNR